MRYKQNLQLPLEQPITIHYLKCKRQSFNHEIRAWDTQLFLKQKESITKIPKRTGSFKLAAVTRRLIKNSHLTSFRKRHFLFLQKRTTRYYGIFWKWWNFNSKFCIMTHAGADWLLLMQVKLVLLNFAV